MTVLHREECNPGDRVLIKLFSQSPLGGTSFGRTSNIISFILTILKWQGRATCHHSLSTDGKTEAIEL